MRAAYSNIVRDSMDYSTAVCDFSGKTIAQGLTNPVHLGSFPHAMKNLVFQQKANMNEGDIFIFNDPYGSGGMHLPDFYIIKPIFINDSIEENWLFSKINIKNKRQTLILPTNLLI